MRTKEKGITLVALVVTIIILLILAGITISALTGSGLFEKANEAKEREKISTLYETLQLKLIEYEADKSYNNISIEGYIEYLKEKEIIKDENIEETGDEKSKYITLEDKYIFLIEEEVKEIKITFLGKKGKIPPIIKDIKVLNKTTNSIKIEVDTKLSDGATYKYYIKDKDVNKFEEKENSKDTVYEYIDLTHGKKYIIKVEVIGTNGEKTEKEIEVELETVTRLTTENTTFVYSIEGEIIDKETWTNKKVIVTAGTTIDTTATKFTIQTSKDGETWNNSTSQEFTENGTIFVRLWDGKNYGGTASGNITNIDKNAPTIPIITNPSNGEWTGEDVTITLQSTDNESKIDYYEWCDDGEWTQKNSSTVNEVGKIIFNTDQNGTIKFRAIDMAGNASQEATTVLKIDKTPPVITLSISSKTVTITSDVTNLYAQSNYTPVTIYNVDGTGIWGGTDDIEDISETEPGPITSAKTWKITKQGIQKEWNGFEGDYNGIFDLNQNDLFIASCFYKTSSAAGITTMNGGGFCMSDWSSAKHIRLRAKIDIIEDGKWHFVYKILRVDEKLTDAIIIDNPRWDYSTQSGTLYINGLNWRIIPSNNTTASDISIIKYASGNQTVEYFKNGGGTYANGNQFTVPQNGTYTIYAEDFDGNGIVKVVNI